MTFLLLDIFFGTKPYRNLERVNLCRSRAVRRICCSLLECWESSGRIQRELHMYIPGGTPYITQYARWNVGKDYFPLLSHQSVWGTSPKTKHITSSLVSECQKCLFEQTLPNGVLTSRVEEPSSPYETRQQPVRAIVADKVTLATAAQSHPQLTTTTEKECTRDLGTFIRVLGEHCYYFYNQH